MSKDVSSTYSIKDNFQWVVGYTYPMYRAWTDAVPVTGIELSVDTGVESIRVVADLNNDGFDDVVIDNGDVREAKPIILFSNGDGTFNNKITIDGSLTERTNREVKAADLNADGLLDLVFFPAPHGWKKSTLGSSWDSTDPQIVLMNQGNQKFKLVNEIYSAREGYFHSGEVADLNGDGRLDIFPLDEYPPSETDLGGGNRTPYLQRDDGSFQLANFKLPMLFDSYQTPNIAIGDINGDLIDDFVIAIKKYDSGKTYDLATPSLVKPLLAYALGKRGVSMEDLDWKFGGKHWIDQTKINKIHAQGGTWIDPHSQLANIQDLNGDGLKEIITSELIYSDAAGMDTGGAIGVYRWSASGLENVTQEFFPYQPSREDGWLMDFSLVDINGDGLKDFVTMSSPNWNNPYTAQLFMNEGGVFLPTLFENVPRTNYFGRVIRNLSGDFNGDGAPDIVGLSRSIERDSQGHFLSKEIGVITLLNNNLPDRLKNLAVVGTSANDYYEFFDRDSIRPSGGDDSITGIPNKLQTAYYWGIHQDYQLSRTASNIRVDARSQNEGVDVLKNIERLSFADKNIAFDLDGNAGKVAKLLGATFGKSALANKEYVGAGLSLLDRGMSYQDLAALAVSVTKKSSATDICNLLWTNIFGKAPTAADIAPYKAMLDSGQMSIGALTALAADTSFNSTNIDLVGLSRTGLEYV